MTRTVGGREIVLVGIATWLFLTALFLLLSVPSAADDATWVIYGVAILVAGVIGVGLMASRRLRPWGIGLLVGLGASLVSDVIVIFLVLNEIASDTA